MHILAGLAALACFVGFAFGQSVARVFVGALLGLGATLILLILFIAAVDINRQSSVKPHSAVHMGSRI